MLNALFRFAFGTIIFVGILGNLHNVFVFAKRKLWTYFTTRLIFYLSLVDSFILVLCGVESFAEFQFDTDVRVISTIFCKMDTFLAYFLLHVRTILSLAILINRNFVFLRIMKSKFSGPKTQLNYFKDIQKISRGSSYYIEF